MKSILLALLLSLPLMAQSTLNNQFFLRDADASLSSAALDVTVQQPTSGSRYVLFESAEVFCSVVCVVSILRDGTAASTTTATPVALNGGITATADGFIDSNAGSGTLLLTRNLAAAETVIIDLTGFQLEPNNLATNNLTVQTDAITGSASIVVRWKE